MAERTARASARTATPVIGAMLLALALAGAGIGTAGPAAAANHGSADVQWAQEVLRTLVFHEVQVAGEGQSWFQVRTMPYRTQDNRIDGVVITFVDVTQQKALESRVRDALAAVQAPGQSPEARLLQGG